MMKNNVNIVQKMKLYNNKKVSYTILNNLSIHKNNFHIIEDYLRYYLLNINRI